MTQAGPSPLQILMEELQAELEQTQRELQDVTSMVNKSRSDVEKAAQRNATITAQVRQLQANLEAVPRADLKAAYDAAQDSQQRLFAMRGQMEKLQSDQANLERQVERLTRLLDGLQSAGVGAGPAAGAAGDGKPMIVRVIEAQEAERQKLSRQIHDGPAQALSNFVLQSEIAVRLFDKDQDLARQEMGNMKASAASTLQKIRDFIFDLRPMMLDDLGVVPTIKRYVDTFKEKSGVQTTLTVTGAERRLESVREVIIFRAIQELLGNVRNHANAAQVRVAVDLDDRRVRVVVEDNGKGFDTEPLLQGQSKTIGLPTLLERVGLLGGQFDIESQSGQGTQVIFEVPVG